jgi:hypothetical protein
MGSFAFERRLRRRNPFLGMLEGGRRGPFDALEELMQQ